MEERNNYHRNLSERKIKRPRIRREDGGSEQDFQRSNSPGARPFNGPRSNYGSRNPREVVHRNTDDTPRKSIQRKIRSSAPIQPDSNIPVRLNRFIAQCGVCARRDADALITAGLIKVNGEKMTELGARVTPNLDKVEYNGKIIRPQNFVYILYNKPKNTISTTEDPEGRNTVISAIERYTRERLFPVGRLDRNTTGLLLLTNDGEFAAKMTHPSHKVRKLYKVRLNKDFAQEDFDKLQQGLELEDGPAKVDKLSYVEGRGMKEVGVEIHMGKNRIVRRMFESLGYYVDALDRVSIGYLTKKNLPRGKWRKLTDREISFLKMN